MKFFKLFLLSILFSSAAFAQSNPDDVTVLFAQRNESDMKLYDGFNVQSFNYYYSKDTLYCKFYGDEKVLPLSVMDLSSATVNEEKKWMTTDKEKIWQLSIRPKKGKHFPGPFTSLFSGIDPDVVLFFPSEEMAQNALVFLKDPHELHEANETNDQAFEDMLDSLLGTGITNTNNNSNDNNATLDKIMNSSSGSAVLDKVLANRDDEDYHFSLEKRTPSTFKYYLRNDSLWYLGSELFYVVMPLKNIDLEKPFVYESSIWKNADGSKCVEFYFNTKAGKLFGQDFDLFGSMSADIFKRQLTRDITITGLVMPDKRTAELLIDYLKRRTE